MNSAAVVDCVNNGASTRLLESIPFPVKNGAGYPLGGEGLRRSLRVAIFGTRPEPRAS